jgi:phosphoglycolate phosphatase-like HAD superfamily hydrolase
LRLLFGEANAHHLDKVDFDELNKQLEPIQDYLAPLYVHPFHGLTELFTWLGANHMDLGIFTSGNRRMIIRNFGVSLPVLGFTDLFRLDKINISERFEAFIARAQAVYGIPQFSVVTCEDVTKTKPDPEGILRLMEKLTLSPDEIIVLGDHTTDMKAAKAAGAHAIGISHGFGSPAELKEAGAVLIIEDLASLPKIIEAHNSGESEIF